MNTREQFGKYLLLKKLTEDPMGETFRAGLLGSKGMERVALLRIFNGQGLDGNRLWQAVESRSAVQEALKSPNIGEGIEMGQIEGIPFVAYDYVSGKNMAKLLEQAAKKRNFVPAEHALLITERIALALASATETRFGGERILHGFLVPHLTIISNEGETRLLGFEYGPGLRSFAQNPVIRQHFGRYLAPESLAGAAPHQMDDIYSLGVILFELLTGRPLPPPGQDGFNTVIDQGVVATEGTPIPAELAALLKQSLVPRDHRIKDVSTWHKTLNKYMFEGQYNPTTFNLAFFMHNLFRQEIEKESQEIEVEKTLPVPTVQDRRELTGTGVVAAAPPPVPDQAPPGEGTAAGEKTENFIPEYAKDEKKSNTGMIIGLVAAALIAVAGAGYFMTQGGDKGAPAAAEAAPPPPPAVEKPAEPEYTGPTEEEIKAQIAELVGQQSSLLEQQYEDKLKQLENQLETARKEEEARAARLAEEERQRIAAEEEAARQAEEEKIAAAEAEAAAKAAEEQKLKEAEAAKLAEAEAAKPKPEPAPAPAAVAPKPEPAKAQVRRGDLVAPGPGVRAPEPTRKITPRFPEMAKRFNKTRATVQVKLLIDENGKVLKAELASEPQKFGFDSEALKAAKRSQWKPATKNGVPVKMWKTLTVEFGA